MNSFHELTYMETSCMLLKLKDEIDALSKTKAHIQDEMNNKIKNIDHKIAIKMELQAQILARNIRYLRVNEKTKGSGYYSCLLYTSPSPRDATLSRMPSSA